MDPATGLMILLIAVFCGLCLAAGTGGWIYRQYDATEESFAEFQEGRLTTATFPTETIRIGKGTMPVLARCPKSGDLFCNALSGPLYRSGDGGQSWEEWSKPPGMTNEAFGVSNSGTMLLAGSWPFESMQQPDRMTALRFFRSTDHGKTWDQGKNIDLSALVLPDGRRCTGDFFLPGAGYSGPGYAAGPANLVGAYGRIVELANGTMVLPFYVGGNCNKPNGQPYETYAVVARSSNDGQSWADCSVVSVDFNEVGVLEIPGGELLAVMRGETTTGWEHLNLHCLTGFIRSLDKGRTWSRYEIIAGTWQRNEHASDIVRLSDGALIVPTIRRTQAFVSRGVPVTVSYDNGVTWSRDYRMALRMDTDWQGGFPSSVVLEDDTIVTVDGGGPDQILAATRWKLPAEMRKYVGKK